MGILANPSYFEQEAQGHIDQVLAAVRYTGPSRKYSGNAVANQGRFPDRHTFLHGQWYVAFIPESVPEGDPGSGVAWFERSSEFEVEYDPSEIARILLEKNYLSLDPAGPIGDGDSLPGFRSKLEAGLGLEDEIEAGMTFEDQLRELADIEDAPATDDPDPVQELVNEHDRGELKELVKDAREDASEFSLRGKDMEEMAAFLVSKRNEGGD